MQNFSYIQYLLAVDYLNKYKKKSIKEKKCVKFTSFIAFSQKLKEKETAFFMLLFFLLFSKLPLIQIKKIIKKDNTEKNIQYFSFHTENFSLIYFYIIMFFFDKWPILAKNNILPILKKFGKSNKEVACSFTVPLNKYLNSDEELEELFYKKIKREKLQEERINLIFSFNSEKESKEIVKKNILNYPFFWFLKYKI